MHPPSTLPNWPQLVRAQTLVHLGPQPECPGGKFINQHTGHNAVQDAKYDTHESKQQNGHPQTHQKKAHQICGPHYNLIHTTFHFCSGIVRLQQIVNGQVVHREKDTHANNGYKHNAIVQRIIGSSRSPKQHIQPSSQNHCRKQIDFYNFPLTNPKQLQYFSGFFIKRIRQKTVITVHK